MEEERKGIMSLKGKKIVKIESANGRYIGQYFRLWFSSKEFVDIGKEDIFDKYGDMFTDDTEIPLNTSR